MHRLLAPPRAAASEASATAPPPAASASDEPYFRGRRTSYAMSMAAAASAAVARIRHRELQTETELDELDDIDAAFRDYIHRQSSTVASNAPSALPPSGRSVPNAHGTSATAMMMPTTPTASPPSPKQRSKHMRELSMPPLMDGSPRRSPPIGRAASIVNKLTLKRPSRVRRETSAPTLMAPAAAATTTTKEFDMADVTASDIEADFAQLREDECAQQLALVDGELLRAIHWTECMDNAWLGRDKQLRAPGILAMIEQFNSLALFVASEVLREEDLARRVRLVGKFILIAEECRKAANFNSLKAILTGLQCTPVFRLRRTWAAVSVRRLRLFEELCRLLSQDSNFAAYRVELGQALQLGPCIPYLGTYLTDLSFATTAHTSGADAQACARRAQMESEVREYLQRLHAASRYPYPPNVLYRSYFTHLRHNSEEQNYQLSLLREPKEKLNVRDSDGLHSWLQRTDLPNLQAEHARQNEQLQRIYASISRQPSAKQLAVLEDEMWTVQRLVTAIAREIRQRERFAGQAQRSAALDRIPEDTLADAGDTLIESSV